MIGEIITFLSTCSYWISIPVLVLAIFAFNADKIAVLIQTLRNL